MWVVDDDLFCSIVGKMTMLEMRRIMEMIDY